MRYQNLLQMMRFSILVLLPLHFWAQEFLVPLQGRPNAFFQKTHLESRQQSQATLALPFKDDFSYAYKTDIPHLLLWNGPSVYVNHGMAKSAPSLGMLTFDGLNRWGLPYQPEGTNFSISEPADTLVSQPINLKLYNGQPILLSDSIALSFYIIPGALGDMPEIQDSIILDFYNPQLKTWKNRIWFMKGPTVPQVNDSIFKRVFIPFNTAEFLQDSFQFRFRNKATPLGAFDTWHIDYVYLDRFRNAKNDTVYNDICFTRMPGPIFLTARQLPFTHFKPDLLRNSQSVYISNLNSTAVNMQYERTLQFSAQPPILYNGGYTNLLPFASNGISSYVPHAQPPLNLTPTPWMLSQSISLNFLHRLRRGAAINDFFSENDSLQQQIQLLNYFAMDDGAAECGYINKSKSGKMAYKIELQQSDTVQGLQLCFDPVAALKLKSLSYRFNIKIWSDVNAKPGIVLYDNGASYPRYADSTRMPFTTYLLKTPVILSKGSYYVGIEQYVAEGIPIGFDRNTDFSNRLWIDAGAGWQISGLYGALMMRPLMGSAVLLSLMQNQKSDRVVFPNPAHDQISFKTQFCDGIIDIYNSIGQKVYTGNLNQNTISVTNWPNGCYAYRILQNKDFFTGTFIISHP